MTNREALEYAKEVSFCCGCTEYMNTDNEYNPCDDCKHRQFFELVIKVLESGVNKRENN